ncbi:hypothetical protein, partial [Pseudomonas aeruginosa]|uniref:hypothetical protein n=1 Tax=Pseudomonas aeruginosa TaxID=287 RepID=UPI0028846491
VCLATANLPASLTVNSLFPNIPRRTKYFRAEVHLQEGGQDYDIMGWSRDGVIGDILDQYERHMHFLHVVR